MKTKRYYLISYRERSGENENDGKFLIYTTDPDKATEEVLSEFYGEQTRMENNGDDYWNIDGTRIVSQRGCQRVSQVEAKTLMKFGTNVLYREGE